MHAHRHLAVISELLLENFQHHKYDVKDAENWRLRNRKRSSEKLCQIYKVLSHRIKEYVDFCVTLKPAASALGCCQVGTHQASCNGEARPMW